jgi:glycerol-3-phosphate dehydrogenase
MPEPPEDADLIVIGAGVNGAAAARDAVLRGLRTVLVDAEDLSAGTSSTSSRLIHGGIRYLEHGEVRLVRESLRERERLLHAAPHLVAPYGLLIPFYQHNRRSPRTLRLGMVAYDVLSADKTTPHHRVLSAGKVQREYPGLDPTGLQGAALYFDAQVPYAERLSVEQAVDAAAAGATVLTHWRVTRLRRGAGSVNEVSLRDELTQAEAVVQAQAVVNAAGPWVDYVLAVDAAAPNRRLVRGSKGSHFTVARFPGAPPTGVHYEARSDARAILVLPVDDDRILIGSTDIFEGDPGDAVCSDEEIDYLLGEVNQLIPTANLGPDDVLHSYAGVRPLPHTPAAKSTAEGAGTITSSPVPARRASSASSAASSRRIGHSVSSPSTRSCATWSPASAIPGGRRWSTGRPCGPWPGRGPTARHLIHYKQIVLTGSSDCRRSDYGTALRLIESGKVETAAMVTHRFPLSAATAAIDMVTSGEAIKVAVIPG